jgi:hypothetical protein
MDGEAINRLLVLDDETAQVEALCHIHEDRAGAYGAAMRLALGPDTAPVALEDSPRDRQGRRPYPRTRRAPLHSSVTSSGASATGMT